MALINVKKGKYGAALDNMGSNTLNKALAEILSKEYKKAETTLANCEDKNTAIGNYLSAIVAIRTGDKLTTIEHLGKAIDLNSSLREKIKKDREFISLYGLASFARL